MMEPEELDQKLDQLYNSAQSANSEGLREEALKRCEEALQLLETYGEEVDRHTYSDFVMLVGDIHWGAGDFGEAYKAYRKVALNDPERLDSRVACGVALFHLCRFTAAKALLEMCSLEDSNDPETWYYLGLIALREEKRELAMNHFIEAHELQDNRFFIPVDVSEKEIVRIVEKLIDDIPDPLREAIENVPIILEQSPSEELLFSEDPPLDPLLLGLFDGEPLTDASSFHQVTQPTRIILFTDNIWLLGYDKTVLEEELWVTLKHEIGHFLGLSEEDLAERGLD